MMTLSFCDPLPGPSMASAYSSGRQGQSQSAHRVTSGPLLLVVVDRFPKSNPNIEQPQAAAQTADKTVCHERSQSRISKQQVVVSPFRPPGQDDQKHSSDRAEKYKHHYDDPMKPEVGAAMAVCYGVLWRGVVAGVGTAGRPPPASPPRMRESANRGG